MSELQRIGRTGRNKEGYVHLLCSEGREERDFDKAKDRYKHVQQFIIKDEQLELYDDVERLIPENIKPECINKTMNSEEYVLLDSNEEKFPETAKRVRKHNAMRNTQSVASTSSTIVKDSPRKEKKRTAAQFYRNFSEDDSDDQQIAASTTSSYRRTRSIPDSTSRPKKRLRRITMAPDSESPS